MTTKTYGQMCPLARSLDVLGERWTILVIRELLLGPKRFKHLLATLPGIGSNRLSDRLRGLEDAGIVRKTVLPAPATVPVYELTVDGERLRDPLLALGLWGLDLPLDERIDPGTAHADLIALCLTATQTELVDPSRRETFEFRVGDEVFHLQLRDGRFLARSGPSPTDPTLRVALRSSGLHGTRASSGDPIASAQGSPGDHPPRDTHIADRGLPRAGLHAAVTWSRRVVAGRAFGNIRPSA